MFNNLSAVFFAEEMAMTLVNSAEPELNEIQGYAISRYKLFTILLVTPTQIYFMGTTIPLYVIICRRQSHIHTRIEQCGFKIIFQDLIR